MASVKRPPPQPAQHFPGPDAKLKDLLEHWIESEDEDEDEIYPIMQKLFGTVLNRKANRFFMGGEPDTAMQIFDDSVKAKFAVVDQVFYHEFKTFCCEWSLPPAVQIKEADRYAKLDAPSTFVDSWVETQQPGNTLEILCLRPTACSWVSIYVMHPVFYRISDTFDQGKPEPCDFDTARRLCGLMSRRYDDKVSRQQAINKFLMENLFIPNKIAFLPTTTGKGPSITDGSALDFGISITYRNEKGGRRRSGETGGDPYLENMAHFAHYTAANRMNGQHDCCPFLLVEVVGHEMGLAGAVRGYDDYVCGQPLTNNVPFLHPSGPILTRTQARLCMALRLAVVELQQWYLSHERPVALPPAALDAPLIAQAQFPYPRQANIGSDKDVSFKYISHFGDERQRRMLFVAQRCDDQQTKFLVKFTEIYNGRNVHKELARKGWAPQLHDVRDCSGHQMIVMELLENVRMWREADAETKAYRTQLKTIVAHLASKNMVHGDLRAPNICVCESTEQIFLVDFDWAGEANKATYPELVNPAACDWHPDVQTGARITLAHDAHMLERLLDPLGNPKKRPIDAR